MQKCTNPDTKKPVFVDPKSVTAVDFGDGKATVHLSGGTSVIVGQDDADKLTKAKK